MKTLLLVDADGDCERYFSQIASRRDYCVLVAKTSRQALEIVKNQIARLDLIVVDIEPGVHGLALLEAVSACADRPPIIVVTALEETYMRFIAAEHGAAACFGKPLEVQKLSSTINDLFANKGLTCDRWGHLVPPPVRKWTDIKSEFEGIAEKLSASN